MSAPITDASRPRLARGVRLREDPVRGRTVLLAPERILNASPTAVEVLKRCDGTRSVGDIVDELAATFVAKRADIAADVGGLLSDLAAKRLVEL